MKQIKISAITFAILFLSCNISASKPVKMDRTADMPANLLMKIETIVTLTDSQKTIIHSGIDAYSQDLKNIQLQNDQNLKKSNKERIILNFRTLLDSILTDEQKSILESKRIEKIKLTQKH